jgi:hypothetical protein
MLTTVYSKRIVEESKINYREDCEVSYFTFAY